MQAGSEGKRNAMTQSLTIQLGLKFNNQQVNRFVDSAITVLCAGLKKYKTRS